MTTYQLLDRNSDPAGYATVDDGTGMAHVTFEGGDPPPAPLDMPAAAVEDALRVLGGSLREAD